MLLWPLERFMQTHMIALYLTFRSCAAEVSMVINLVPNGGQFLSLTYSSTGAHQAKTVECSKLGLLCAGIKEDWKQ